MFLNFKTVRNIRDLGGISNKEGKFIKNKLLLRGGDLASISQDEFNILINEYNLKTVIDFRSKNSYYTKKDAYNENINYYHYFVLDFLDNYLYKIDMELSFDEFFYTVYRGFAKEEKAINAYKGFFKNVLDTNSGATYFHCTSGKDRTGIAAILLLKVLDVDEDLIYKETLKTNEYTQKEFNIFLKNHKNLSMKEYDFYKHFYILEKEYIDIYFDEINKNYGSIDNFIVNILGINEEIKTILKNRYLTNY